VAIYEVYLLVCDECDEIYDRDDVVNHNTRDTQIHDATANGWLVSEDKDEATCPDCQTRSDKQCEANGFE